MIQRDLIISLVCVVGLGFGCKKKSDDSSPDASEEQAGVVDGTGGDADKGTAAEEPGTPADFLVGKWASECINQPPGYLRASVIVQYDFALDGNASSKILSYAGADCTRRYTKPQVDDIVASTNAERTLAGTAPLSAAELALLNELWFPTPSPFTFKLGKKLKDTSVEMNSTDRTSGEVINTYLTIYVENETDLYFAAICLKQNLDAGECNQIVGDSVKNRARDMSNALPFHKI